jgi:tRNA-splicing ligase RtcB
MAIAASEHGLELPDQELACAPIRSLAGQTYLGAMRAGINCALANRQILTHLARQVFADVLPRADLRLLYDVSEAAWAPRAGSSSGRRTAWPSRGVRRATAPAGA